LRSHAASLGCCSPHPTLVPSPPPTPRYSLWVPKLHLSYKSALLFSASCAFAGNLLYAYAITPQSLNLAYLGRFLTGLGSAEVVNRQFITAFVDRRSMVRSCAWFVAAGAMGMSLGPLVAGVLDSSSGRDLDVDINVLGGLILNHVTNPGWIMMVAWLLQITLLTFFFFEDQAAPEDADSGPDAAAAGDEEEGEGEERFSGGSKADEEIEPGGNEEAAGDEREEDSDDDDDDDDEDDDDDLDFGNPNGKTPQFPHDEGETPPTSPLSLVLDEGKALLGGATANANTYGAASASPDDATGERPFSSLRSSLRSSATAVSELAMDYQRAFFSNRAFPVMLFLFFLIELTDEILINSVALITRRYFSWHGAGAGYLIASLMVFVLPANYLVDKLSNFYDERSIAKHSVLFCIVGVVLILNFEVLLGFPSLGQEVDVSIGDVTRSSDDAANTAMWHRHKMHLYDGSLGIYQYAAHPPIHLPHLLPPKPIT
jgi:hypothetical protein